MNPDWKVERDTDGWWSYVYFNGRCEEVMGPFKKSKPAEIHAKLTWNRLNGPVLHVVTTGYRRVVRGMILAPKYLCGSPA